MSPEEAVAANQLWPLVRGMDSWRTKDQERELPLSPRLFRESLAATGTSPPWWRMQACVGPQKWVCCWGSYLEVAAERGSRAGGLRASTLNNNGGWKENCLSLTRHDRFSALYWRSLTFSRMAKGKCLGPALVSQSGAKKVGFWDNTQ